LVENDFVEGRSPVTKTYDMLKVGYQRAQPQLPENIPELLFFVGGCLSPPSVIISWVNFKKIGFVLTLLSTGLFKQY
jgi:hypothetical protein